MEVNQKTLANLLSISVQKLKSLTEKKIFELIPGSKYYDLKQCIARYLDFKIKEEVGRCESGNKKEEAASGSFNTAVNQITLAYILDLSARQIRNLKKEQGMFAFIPQTKKYDLRQCVKEYINFKSQEATGRKSYDKEKEQGEHEHLKKQLTEIKLRKARKEVHEAADVRDYWNGMLTNFRNYLTAVPAKIAPTILNESDINVIINQLQKEMLSALAELSEYDPADVDSGVYEPEEDEEETEEGEE